MNPEPLELLSAFVDGEPVEPAALAEALTAPDARQALRDFVLLRAEVRNDDSMLSATASRAIRRDLAAGSATSWWRRAIPIPAPALAAVVVLALGVAAWTGIALRRPVADPFDAPPVPDRVLRLEAVEAGSTVGFQPDSGGDR